jgi:hypothetical protein
LPEPKPRLWEPWFLLLGIEVVLDAEAVSNRARVLVDLPLERGNAPGQVVHSRVAMVVGDVLAQPAPQRLHRHQVGAVSGQRRKLDASENQTVLRGLAASAHTALAR